jgi:soluble lytic murein transglycosylase-like protein
MDINADLAAIGRRIAEITGTGMSVSFEEGGSFARIVQVVEARVAPAPVPPAQIDGLVAANATAWKVDPALVKAIVANESGFDANATSRTGAQGLMQLEPGTAAELGVSDAYDPAQNISGGTRYIKGLLERFHGDVRLAVAAYNAGAGAVEKYGGVPPYAETQTYVQNVLASYARYRAVRADPGAP